MTPFLRTPRAAGLDRGRPHDGEARGGNAAKDAGDRPPAPWPEDDHLGVAGAGELGDPPGRASLEDLGLCFDAGFLRLRRRFSERLAAPAQ